MELVNFVHLISNPEALPQSFVMFTVQFFHHIIWFAHFKRQRFNRILFRMAFVSSSSEELASENVGRTGIGRSGPFGTSRIAERKKIRVRDALFVSAIISFQIT